MTAVMQETRARRTRSRRKTSKPASVPVQVVDSWEDEGVHVVVIRLDVPADRTRIELQVKRPGGGDVWRTVITG